MMLPQLLLNQIQLLNTNLSSSEIERDLGVHAARKCCKRVRAGLRLSKGLIPDETLNQENSRFRDAALQLSAARDSWVMIETLDALLLDDPEQLVGPGFNQSRAKLVERYEGILQAELANKNLVPDILAAVKQSAAVLEGIPMTNSDFATIEKNLQATRASGVVEMAQAFTTRHPEDFHEWRKRVKDLQYQSEFVAEITGRDTSAQVIEIDSLSEMLGQDHDLAVLGGQFAIHFEPLLSANELGTLLKVINQKRSSLQEQARGLGQKIYRNAI